MKPKLSKEVPDTLPDHLFCLNANFQRSILSFSFFSFFPLPFLLSDMIRINVQNALVSREKDGEDEEMRRQIEESRRLEIQAGIVRIMKAQKRMEHRLLVLEVINQLRVRFEPTVPQIKRCIDILIEKEYLERVDSKGDSYRYLS